jgi:Predicted pyridoxal phosphate-dependent enzyme apparently involved in regulation of cell wall biogenesis
VGVQIYLGGFFGILIKEPLQIDAKEFMKRLSDEGIGSRPFFYPIHKQPVYEYIESFKKINHPISENLAKKGFYIPSGLSLTEQDIEHVSNKINSII